VTAHDGPTIFTTVDDVFDRLAALRQAIVGDGGRPIQESSVASQSTTIASTRITPVFGCAYLRAKAQKLHIACCDVGRRGAPGDLPRLFWLSAFALCKSINVFHCSHPTGNAYFAIFAVASVASIPQMGGCFRVLVLIVAF
jgi:hypothetical protein